MDVGNAIVKYVAACKLKHPELASRVDRAAAIVRHGGLTRVTDSTWLIPSSSGGAGYIVNGTCTCPDYTGIHPQSGDMAPVKDRAPRGWCKHRLAMLMLIKLATDSERGS